MMNLVGKTTTGERKAVRLSEERQAETELIRLCIEGDRGAQERFYRAHCRLAAANLYRVLGSRQDLEDLVQEVFVIAFRGLPKFRQDARLSTWIYRICVNVALGRIRTKSRKPPPILKADPTEGQPGVSPDSPRTLLERQEAKCRVYSLLERMAPKKRLVLYLHEIEGRNLKEIAYLVGVHPGTVRTRLFYARKEFYALVAAGEGA